MVVLPSIALHVVSNIVDVDPAAEPTEGDVPVIPPEACAWTLAVGPSTLRLDWELASCA